MLSNLRRLNNNRGNNPLSDIINVNVIENNALQSSVWLGGSILASTDEFFDLCRTKQQYEEEGSRIFRQNIAFRACF